MKKQEMEQLTIGTVVANKLAQYTITKIEEIDGAKVYTLDDIRTAKETTMKRNYTLVHLAEQESTEESETTTEETTEQVTLAVVEPQPEAQPEEPTEATDEAQTVVNPTAEATDTTMTKKQIKAQAKAKILALNKTITDAIDADLRGNLSYIVDDRKGRIAIKIRPVDEAKPRVILDLVLNSKGAKAHVRREAIHNIEYYRAKNMTKALPERWALNLEVQIDSLHTFWDLLDSGLNFELARIEAKKNKQEEKAKATA